MGTQVRIHKQIKAEDFMMKFQNYSNTLHLIRTTAERTNFRDKFSHRASLITLNFVYKFKLLTDRILITLTNASFQMFSHDFEQLKANPVIPYKN